MSSRIVLAWLCGFLAGASLIVLVDPASRRRRARLRDQSRHQVTRASRALGRRLRYEEGHLRGLAHEAAVRTHVESREPLADLGETLVDKVRSEGFRGEHEVLRQVNLTAVDGIVHVYGSAHNREDADAILSRVRGVEGVREVVDHLVVAAG